jgi:hypothetical protein
MPSRNSSIKPNGHAGSHGRVNGHAPASTEGGGIPVPRDHAASVDTRRASAAMDARCTVAPGTDCAGYAEVAPSSPNGNELVSAEKPPRHSAEKKKETEQIPGGEFPLPLHPDEFVEEIHRNADLFIVWKELLNSKDEKIRQRAVEKLTEMRYRGAAALADEPRQIVIDIPRPKRD